MTDQPKNAKDIFLEVIDIDSPEDRQAFLNQACERDAKLRRRVEAYYLLMMTPRATLTAQLHGST